MVKFKELLYHVLCVCDTSTSFPEYHLGIHVLFIYKKNLLRYAKLSFICHMCVCKRSKNFNTNNVMSSPVLNKLLKRNKNTSVVIDTIVLKIHNTVEIHTYILCRWKTRRKKRKKSIVKVKQGCFLINVYVHK